MGSEVPIAPETTIGRIVRGLAEAWRVIARNPLSSAGVVLVLAITAVAILAPVLAPYDPTTQHLAQRLSPPSATFPLGSDSYGRDVLSRLLWGARSSLLVGVGSVLVGAVVGVSIGMYVGYVGGWVESLAMRIIDAMMAFPSLVLALMFVTALGSSLSSVIVAIAATMVPKFARLAQGATIALKEREFVQAARAAGASTGLIVVRHVLPNILGPLIVLATLNIAYGIRTEASLGFLGAGIRPPHPTWGNMIKDGLDHIMFAPWLATIPGIAIVLSVLGFNLAGDGLRDYLDPQSRTQDARGG